MQVLIVDGANVVGRRPDGWWRDRVGAARRLWQRLVAADLSHDVVVLVVEGAASRGFDDVDATADAGAVRGGRRAVVRAAGHGDDAIVEEVRGRSGPGCEVTVVTADRGLRDRVTTLGARVVGPTWLLEVLDAGIDRFRW